MSAYVGQHRKTLGHGVWDWWPRGQAWKGPQWWRLRDWLVWNYGDLIYWRGDGARTQ